LEIKISLNWYVPPPPSFDRREGGYAPRAFKIVIGFGDST